MTNASADRIAAIRRFNRFYTKKIGVLDEGYLRTPFSVAEARVIYELALRESATAGELAADLDLDPAYLSRMIRDLGRRRLIRRRPSRDDRRKTLLTLSSAGHAAFTRLNAESQVDIASMIERVSLAQQRQLVGAMATIESLLGAPQQRPAGYLLRPPRPGDYGWVVHRHGALYAQEYGWNEEFEALVAQIIADFVKHHDAKRERGWIAEIDGENVGSVFLVKKSKHVAKLRLLLVEPQARGLGIGTRLVEECIRHARLVGYKKLVLWTDSLLTVARNIYEKSGFRLVNEESHHDFDHDLVGQTWELKL